MPIPFKFNFDLESESKNNVRFDASPDFSDINFLNQEFDPRLEEYLPIGWFAKSLGTELLKFKKQEKNPPEQELLFLEYKRNQTPENLRKLLDSLEPIIVKGWKTFGKGVPALKIYAKIIAINAIQSYDPKKGSLNSHIMLHLQRLNRLLPEVSNVVDVPEALRIKAKMLRESEIELEDKLGRPPSDQELADHLKLSLKQIQAIRRAQGAIPESVVSGNLPIKSKIELDDETKLLIYEAVYKDLSPIQQYIMERRLGLHGHRIQSVEEIAKRLKISPAAVSQHIQQIEQKLNLVEETLYAASRS